ncbi:ATP-binding protein [Amycolatopsis anabasis]|uniref:ATP-binding protein n=1 Tax=Amycolatopsis anabasis TaxID=1840409 RepID=UPI001FEBA226|nr:LuxR family transcriptional regulator [Amycolatopsis anabasis]
MARADSLIGRDGELSRLAGWVHGVGSGYGRAVLVEGEPGIGKSSLVRAACAQAAESGCQVFWGNADELGQELPLVPLLEGLRIYDSPQGSRAATIARVLRGELPVGRGVDLSGAIAEHLLVWVEELCGAGPTVLVVDDLHWADHHTVTLWGRLARSVRQLPLLLLGILRPVPRRDDVMALRRAVRPAARMRLGPLPDADVAELVGVLSGGKPSGELLRLADGAAGNPLYLTELVHSLARAGRLTVNAGGVAEVTGGGTPASLSEAIADRLGFLSGTALNVLRSAALLGVEFSVSDLTTVAGLATVRLLPVLDDARALGILIESGEGLAFRHPLIRAALYDELPLTVRTAWHRDAARALAESGAPADRVARQLLPTVAGHTGGTEDWVTRWLVGAAPALVGRAPGVAVDLLRGALDGAEPGPGPRGVLTGRLAEALYRVGEAGEAERVAARALDRITDPDLLIDLHGTLAQCRAMSGRSAESLDALRRALDVPGLTAGHRARLLVLRARAHRDLGEVERAEEVATQALALGEEHGDRAAIGWALHVLVLVSMMRGEMAAALPLFDRAIDAAQGDPELTDLHLLLRINQAVTLGDLDRYAEATAAVAAVRAEAERTGNVVRLIQACSALGQLLLDTGGWDQALAEVDVFPAGLKDPSVVCCDHGVAAVICFHRGDVEAAREHLESAAPYADRLGSRAVGPLALAHALAAEQDGDPARALGELTALAELADVEDLLPETVRLAVEAGEEATARAVTARIRAHADRTEAPRRYAAAQYCRGLLDRDPARLLRAADRYRDAGRPLPSAKALEAAARTFAEAGDRSSARAAFSRAVDCYRSLGAAWDEARLGARMRAFGIRRGPRAAHRKSSHGWESLTPAESKIAALVAEGLTNPQIAAKLFLSPRTVGTHVSHILTKLEVHSRTDIAREAGLRRNALG